MRPGVAEAPPRPRLRGRDRRGRDALLGHEHLAAADPLGRVLRRVGGAEQVGRAAVLVVQAGDAARERERLVRRGGQPLRRVARERACRVGPVALHQNAELVAAEPAREAARERLGGLGQRAPGVLQGAVAGVMAEVVVDVLEPVEVAEQQREVAAGHQPARDRLLEALVEPAPVGQPRERVLVGERLEPREQLRAADRRRHLGAQRLGEAHVRGGEGRRAERRVGLEHAPDAVGEADRRRERRAAADPLEEVAFLGRQVDVLERDHVGLAALHEDAVERRQRPRLLLRALLLAGVELAGVGERAHAVVLGLPAADRDPRGAQHLACLLADRVEHLLEPVRAGDRARDGDQRAQLGLERPIGAHARQRGSRRDRLRRGLAGRPLAVEHANQRGDGRRAELRAGMALDLDARLLGRQRTAVGAIGRHRVPGVADEADPARERDRLAGEAVGIAAAVPALVLGAHGGGEVRERADRADDLGADRRVLAHDVPLGTAQPAGLLQDRVGHADLADVVQQRHLADRGRVLGVHPELARDLERQLEHRLGMRSGVVLARVERRQQRLPRRRLDLFAAAQLRALGGVQPVARDPRQDVEEAQVALVELRLRQAAQAAQRAVDRAVAAAHRHARVRADPRRGDERMAGGLRQHLGVGHELRRFARDHRVAPRVVARQREARPHAPVGGDVAVDLAQHELGFGQLGQVRKLHPEQLASRSE